MASLKYLAGNSLITVNNLVIMYLQKDEDIMMMKVERKPVMK